MSLNTKLRALSAIFGSVGVPCQHYWRPVKNAPLLIWAEDGENRMSADNHLAEQGVTGTLDYFTKAEYDSNVDLIQTLLDSNMVAWSLKSVQYEDTTGLIHVEWSWEYV